MCVYSIPSDNPDASKTTRSVTDRTYPNIRQPYIQNVPPLATQKYLTLCEITNYPPIIQMLNYDNIWRNNRRLPEI